MSRYPSSRRVSPKGLFGIGVAAIIALVVIVGVIFVAAGYFNKDDVHIRITGKESVSTGSDNKHEYRVYTDKGTYVVSDSLIYLRFNSADEYGKLIVGHTYDCKSYGFRIPLTSSFKNLLDCHESTN